MITLIYKFFPYRISLLWFNTSEMRSKAKLWFRSDPIFIGFSRYISDPISFFFHSIRYDTIIYILASDIFQCDTINFRYIFFRYLFLPIRYDPILEFQNSIRYDPSKYSIFFDNIGKSIVSHSTAFRVESLLFFSTSG